ncbi:MAG: hypothetical protein A3K46_08295 [Chloroflexi bacterium RBG_13_60_9]|nr:MAG: hypothetical protein A3K46_08295 [Chloroflexi bacterium RBG_13_60_9]
MPFSDPCEYWWSRSIPGNLTADYTRKVPGRSNGSTWWEGIDINIFLLRTIFRKKEGKIRAAGGAGM